MSLTQDGDEMPKKSATPHSRYPSEDKAPTIPISDRMKASRGKDPTDYQNKVIEEFITKEATPNESELFEKGFKNSVALIELETALKRPLSRSARAVYNKRVQSLNQQIT